MSIYLESRKSGRGFDLKSAPRMAALASVVLRVLDNRRSSRQVRSSLSRDRTRGPSKILLTKGFDDQGT